MIIPKRYENAKWEDVPKIIQDSFDRIIDSRKGLYIYGDIGTGKTHIAWAMKKYYDRPDEVRYLRIWNVVDLMHEIKADFDREPSDKRHPEADITGPDSKYMLILDDIGAEKATDFVAETIYRIINHRYIHMLPTIFTSNLRIQELADRIGERSASRIVEMCGVIELTGGDRRLKIL